MGTAIKLISLDAKLHRQNFWNGEELRVTGCVRNYRLVKNNSIQWGLFCSKQLSVSGRPSNGRTSSEGRIGTAKRAVAA
jgi:hypothetical protein